MEKPITSNSIGTPWVGTSLNDTRKQRDLNKKRTNNAKKAINVNNFSGGLNNNTNPRDIADNEFQILNGLDNEVPGKLKTLGSVADYKSSNNYQEAHSVFNKGNGITYLTLDRDIDNAGTIAANELLLINDANAKNVDFYNLAGDKDTAQFSYGSTASPVDSFVIDGQVRLSATSTTATF